MTLVSRYATMESMTSEPTNRVKLLRKIFRVMKAIPELVKTGTMQEGDSKSYAYYEADSIREKFRGELLRNKLLCLPRADNHEQWSNPTSTGGRFNYCLQRITFTFYDIDTGESLDCAAVGIGGDSLDKAAPKAAIQALKYFLTNGFFVRGIELDGDSAEEQLAGREANKQHQWFEGVPEAVHYDKLLSWILIDGVRLFANNNKMRGLVKTLSNSDQSARLKVRTYMGQLSGDGVNPHPIIDKIEVLDVESIPQQETKSKA